MTDLSNNDELFNLLKETQTKKENRHL